MEKLYKEYTPYGKLHDNDQEYWVLAPQPLAPDSWQHELQQMWWVVPNNPLGMNKPKTRTLYPKARMLAVFTPSVELFEPDPILVWTGEFIEEELDNEDEEVSYGFTG